jgi:serine/threonine-protein kinase
MEERFGRWRILRRIARGDLAEVALAVDDSGADPIALKRLHVHVLVEPEVVELFSAERAIACALPAHPNLVGGLEHGVIDGRPYLAMPYVAGEDLRTVRDRGTNLDETAARLVRQAALACAHLHQAAWVHGDVGPANLIVDGSGRAWLCDFGVTRRAGTAGPVRGTHAYMAPEQVRGEAWTPATDVFALGVMLWEFTAGMRLFHRGPAYLTMAAVVEAEVPALSDHPMIDTIARAALTKDPATRIATAAELAALLEGVAK